MCFLCVLQQALIFSMLFCLLQKIMHTKKRHQNMFQDLNRKMHHAEKDRESPASDSKVTICRVFVTCFHQHSFSRDAT